MITKSLLGSWVEGQHLGNQDAIALHSAGDTAAENAYNLERAAQSDPYRLQMIKNSANASNINNDLTNRQYNNGDLYNARHAAAQEEQLKPATSLANLGYTGAVAGLIPQFDPNVQVDDAGFHTPMTDSQGNVRYMQQSPNSLMAPNQLHGYYNNLISQIRAQHEQTLAQREADYNRLGQENFELKQRLGLNKTGGVPATHSVFGSGIPPVAGAPAAAPAVTPNTSAVTTGYNAGGVITPSAPAPPAATTGGVITPNAGATFNMGSSGNTGKNYSKFVDPNQINGGP